MERYITYILYADICFYSIYNMCNHIIYNICKRKFCSSVISRLEIFGNEFAHVCLLPPPPRPGMTTDSGFPASQKRSWMCQVLAHVAKDGWIFIIPCKTFSFSSRMCFVPTSTACFPLHGASRTKESLSLLAQLEPTRINTNFCCHCFWEAQGCSRIVVIAQDTSFWFMLSIS